MRETEFEPEMLNAYVDGELSRDEAARVARAAARDPEIAARIATLRELKAAVPGLVEERGVVLPSRSAMPAGRAALVIAASMVLLLCAGLLHLFLQAEPESARWARLLQSHHEAWAFARNSADNQVLPASGPARLLPLDLESARLTFVGYQAIPFSGEKIIRTGYEGTRGCRVSLYVFPAGIDLADNVFSGGLLVKRWDVQDYGFALMADGMARTRFDGLARAVEKALRAGSQPDPGTRQRLAQARRKSPPCQA